ncbi:hypothetical protein NKG94_01495 [Micromonospora sp. M12]
MTGWVACWPAASTTRTVKLELPAVVGVPESRPVLGFRVSPGGRVPALIDQTNGAVPPLTVS